MANLHTKYHKLFSLNLIITITFCFYSGSSAQGNPIEMFQKALTCFNNKFIYKGCNEAYRLDERGTINVPPQALSLFCNGPCLTETQLVLNCVDNIFSNFVFYNKATVPDVRGAINVGCNYNRQQGLFNWNNFGPFTQGIISSAYRLENSVIFYALLLISGLCYFVIWS